MGVVADDIVGGGEDIMSIPTYILLLSNSSSVASLDYYYDGAMQIFFCKRSNQFKKQKYSLA